MGRREAGQHRPAPPHQARQPLILRPKGTRVSPAMGPLGGYQPGASSSRQERKSRSPASIKENTTPATSYPMSWGRQHGPRPPPHLPGPTGSPPDLQAQQQRPLPTPRGTQWRDRLWTFVLQHSVNLFHRGDRVLRSCWRGQWQTPGHPGKHLPPLLVLTEGSLFPSTKKAVKGIPQAWPARWGGVQSGPRGPCSVDTGSWRPTAQAQLLALLQRTPAPGWASRTNSLGQTPMTTRPQLSVCLQ